MNAIPKRRSSSNIPDTRRHRPSVELLESRQLLSAFVVSNTNDSGPGSLRQAISSSNGATAQTNLITFDLGTSSLQTINLLSALPVITQSVTIEGTTDGNGNPLVELDGASAGSTTNGLVVTANTVTIEGFDMSGFGGDAIDVSGSNDVIADNHIGTPGTNPADEEWRIGCESYRIEQFHRHDGGGIRQLHHGKSRGRRVDHRIECHRQRRPGE